MRRARALGALLLAAAAGCAGPGGQPATGSSGCTRLTLPSANAARPPALVHDLAAFQTEFLAGWPEDQVLRLLPPLATYGAPAPFGHGLIFSRYVQNRTQVWAARSGGCARHLADGTLESFDPGGRAFIVTNGTWHHLDNGEGKTLVSLPAGVFAWTYGGLLAEGDARGTVTVYDSRGHRLRRLSIPGAYPVGALGPRSLLVRSGADVTAYDVDTGASRDVGAGQAFVATGSPDGDFLAVADAGKGPRLVRLADGTSRPLPEAGPVNGFAWSPDSRWLAVDSVYGGDLFAVTDGSDHQLGSLIVTGWPG